MGTAKRARQKAGKDSRRQERKAAAVRSKRIRNVIRVAVLAGIAVGLFFLISYCSRSGEEDTTSEEPDIATAPTMASSPEQTPPLSTDDETPEDEEVKRSGKSPVYTPYGPQEYGTGPCAPAAGATEPKLEFGDNAPALCIDPGKSYTAVFDTTSGMIRVALDSANTPGTVNNFVNLARFGYYNDTLIHRSDPSIGILQGGSPHTNSAADPGPGYQIWDEGTGFRYRPGQLVMARTNNPNSAGAQFFFTVTEDASLLDSQGTYVVFGEVTEGLDVLERILASHMDIPGNRLGGAPNPEVRIRVSIEESDG